MEQTPIDRILAVLAQGEYQEEVKRARAEYFQQLPDLREDDPSFERLTSCFLNWYVFDRPMDGGGGTPLQVFAAQPARSVDDRRELGALAANLHSLFEILKIEAGAVLVRDLFSDETLVVTERRQVAGLQRGDLLEARLLPLTSKGVVFATGAFVLHPVAAREVVLEAVRRARTSGSPRPESLMQRLRSVHFRYLDRYRERVPAEKVYAEVISVTEKAG